jgi:16S rRNA (cytidine1402-2'-O)-methyltransferase
VFFESPRRVAEMLADAAEVLGPRPAAVARELTKFFETVRRGTVETLAAEFASEATPKGEIVVLIGPPTPQTEPANKDDDVDARLRIHLANLSLKDAVDVVAQETNVVRKRVYARAVELKKQ